MQDKVTEIYPELKSIVLHCIIHQEMLCKSVLKNSHVVDAATKIITFIRASTLNQSQFVSLLEEHKSEQSDIGYQTNVNWQGVKRVCHPRALSYTLDGRSGLLC